MQLTPADCFAVQGIPGPVGESCDDYICFPEGACCLPTGDCAGIVSPQAPSTKIHCPPQMLSSCSLAEPGQSGEINDEGWPSEVGWQP